MTKLPRSTSLRETYSKRATSVKLKKLDTTAEIMIYRKRLEFGNYEVLSEV